MKMEWLALALCCATAVSAAEKSEPASAFPSKPIRWVVPFTPGASTDLIARTIGQRLTEIWGKQIIVDNRPGAGGGIGGEIVARAAPDGYTVLLSTSGPNIGNTLLTKKPPYRVEDFAYVAIVADNPMVLVVHPSFPAKRPNEFVEYVKANPGKVNWASAGVNSTPHIAMAVLAAATGIKLTHVPYKGGAGQMIPAIMGNEVQFMFINMASSLSQIRAGRIKPLAITTPERRPELPNVPTTAESGFPGVGTNAWNGLFAPAGVPKPLLKRIHADVVKVMESPEMKASLAKVFMSVVVNKSPEEFQQFVLQEIKDWGRIVVENNIKVE
jgi:tripartite-type tricarboxylate transporter receptor subunit TctC